LRHWLRHSWISRLSLTDWSCRLREWATPARKSGRILVQPFRPEMIQFEERFMPNDPFGLMQTALIGPAFSLLTPSAVLFHGWSTNQDQPDAGAARVSGSIETAAVPPEDSWTGLPPYQEPPFDPHAPHGGWKHAGMYPEEGPTLPPSTVTPGSAGALEDPLGGDFLNAVSAALAQPVARAQPVASGGGGGRSGLSGGAGGLGGALGASGAGLGGFSGTGLGSPSPNGGLSLGGGAGVGSSPALSAGAASDGSKGTALANLAQAVSTLGTKSAARPNTKVVPLLPPPPSGVTVQFSSSNFPVTEPGVGGTTVTIYVTLNQVAGSTVTVDYQTSDGTGTVGEDYTPTSGTLTFNAGSTQQFFTVGIPKDDLDKIGDETVNLTLSNPSNASLGTQSTSVVIIQEGANIISVDPIGIDPTESEMVDFGASLLSPLNGSFELTSLFDTGLNPNQCNCATFGADASAAFRSDSINPKPIVQSEFTSDPSGAVPTSLQAQLTWNGMAQAVENFGTGGHSAGDVYLMDLQAASAVTTTGVYPWSVTVTAAYSGGPTIVKTVSSIDPVVVNGASGPLGPGWSVGGLDYLVSIPGSAGVATGMLYVYGTGESRFFQGSGPYTSPANDMGTLVKNMDGSFTYTNKNQDKWNFDTTGKLTTVVDPHNLTRTFTYSGGLLSTWAEPDGGVATFTYTSGLLTKVAEPGNRALTLAYTSGNLTKIQDPDGSLESFTYDGNGRLNNDQHGPLNTTYSYDTVAGELSQINRGLNNTLTVVPANTQGLATTTAALYSNAVGVLTDGLNHATTYTLDPLGRITRLQTADGGTQAWRLNAAGDPITYVDGLNRVTNYIYGTLEDLTQVNYPDGSINTFANDANFHHQTLFVDGNGNSTTSTYDTTTGDLLTTTDALNEVTTYAYYLSGGRSNGLVQSITDPLNHITSFAYDTNRRVTREIHGFGAAEQTSTTMIYDAAGNLLSQTSGIASANQLLSTTSYAHDAMRRVTQTLEGFGSSVQRSSSSTFDGIGDVLSTTDPNGNVTSFAYDQIGRQITLIAGFGTAVATTTTTIYDNTGNTLSQTSGISTTASYDHHTTTSYGYDAVNRQNQVISGFGAADATTSTMIYDLAGNLLSQTDGISTTASYDHHTTTSYGYDAMNRQNQVIQGFGTSVAVTGTMIYDLAGNLLSQTSGISSTVSYDHHTTTSYAYDALNRGQAIEAFGTNIQRTTTILNDAAGNTLSTTDPLGHITSYAYNALNQQTKVIQGFGTSVAVTGTMIYDSQGNVLSETDNQSTTSSYDHSVTTSYAYNALDQQTKVINAFGTPIATTGTMIYDNAGNLLSETDYQSSTATYDHHVTTSFAYDALNRQTAQIEANGVAGLQRTTTSVYDAAGNVVQSVDALGFTTTTVYDALNRATQVTDPAGDVSTTVYDAASNTVNTIDPNNNKSTFVYDPLNRQTATIDPRGGITTYVFDAASNQVNLIDSVNNKTTFVFDALNRLITQTDPLGHSATFAYSATDRLTSTTDRLGRRRDLSYDALDRQIGETWVSGSTVNTLTYTFDAAGEMLTAADKNGAYTMAYDKLNRVTSQQEPFGQALTFTYDAASNRTLRQDSQNGLSTLTYDLLNRMTTYQFAISGTTTLSLDLTYTARDQVATESRYSDLAGTTLVGTTSMSYDPAMRETRLQFKDASGANISNFTYTYDTGSRLTSETLAVATLTSATTSYQYDAANELTQAGTVTYGYDLNGNRTNTGYSTGTENQLQNDGTWTYTYDKEGNELTKYKGSGATLDLTTYSYDNLNHLVGAVETIGGAFQMQATYVYDVLGNRIEMDVKVGSGTTTITRMAYDGLNAWEDLNGSNILQMRRMYLNGVDQLFARIDSGATTAWYLTDRLGSVRDIANNSTGVSVDHYIYDGYGQVTTESTPANGDRYRYTGREWNFEVGLQYNRARYDQLANGIWTSQDPLGFIPGDPNLYRYVANEPTVSVDPLGTFEIPLHVEITSKAVDAWAKRNHIDPKVWDYVKDVVVRANISQDLEHLLDLKRHYNRPLDSSEDTAEINSSDWLARALRGRQWDRRYTNYLKEELAIFGNKGLDCKTRLQALGRLTHSWQDFFAHAIRVDQGGKTHRNKLQRNEFRNGRLGSEQSLWPGFSAFADTDARTGTPDQHGGLIPSSYSLFKSAEHPIRVEPLSPNGPEFKARVLAAQTYTDTKVNELLNQLIGDGIL
jgi:RHS repeat-associated protein